MNNKRREMMHNLIDGDLALVQVMHQINHYRDCDKILKWLILNNLKGKNLKQWILLCFNNSIMAMVQFIVMKNNKDLETKPIIYNKDWN